MLEGLNVNNVLFITKKKTISSITADYNMYGPSFNIEVINYESLHKIEMTSPDVIICDEAHSMGAFAKANKRAKMVKDLISKSRCKLILMSGTPHLKAFLRCITRYMGTLTIPLILIKLLQMGSRLR